MHPDYCKEITRNKEIMIGRIPQIVEMPLVQRIGTPAAAIVKAGEYVKMGQKIRQANLLMQYKPEIWIWQSSST
ncbi:MAG: hypothetical protein AB7G87_07385 [Clostridia bacterium]